MDTLGLVAIGAGMFLIYEAVKNTAPTPVTTFKASIAPPKT